MGFVVGLYRNPQPAIQSGVFFSNVVAAGSPQPSIFKYHMTLQDGMVWLLYAIPASEIDANSNLVPSTLLQGMPSFFRHHSNCGGCCGVLLRRRRWRVCYKCDHLWLCQRRDCQTTTSRGTKEARMKTIRISQILPYHIIWNPLMAQPRPCSRLNQPPSFIGNKVPSITF